MMARWIFLALAVTLCLPASAQRQRRTVSVDSLSYRYAFGDGTDVQKALAELGVPRKQAPTLTSVDPGEGLELDNAIALAFTPDRGRLVAIGWFSNTLAVHDAATGEFIDGLDLGGSPLGLGVTDDVAVVALPLEHEAVVVDLRTFQVLRRVPLPGEPVSVQLSADATDAWIASIAPDAADRVVTRLDLASGAIEAQFPFGMDLIGGNGYFESPRFRFYFAPFRVLPDDETLLLVTRTHVQFIDAATGQTESSFTIPGDAYDIDISADGTTAAIAGGFDAPVLYFVDLASRLPEPAVLPDSPLGVTTVALSSDGQRALLPLFGGAQIINRDGSRRNVFRRQAIVVPLGNDRAALTGNGRDFGIYDLTDGSLVAQGDAPNAAVAAAPGDGSTFASAGYYETLALRGAGRAPITVPFGEGVEADAPRQLALDASGETVAASLLYSDSIVLLDVRTARVVARYTLGEAERPRGIAFTPEGRVVVGADGVLLLLDAASGDVLSALPTPDHNNRSLFVAPDGERVVSHSSESGVAYIVRIQDDALALQTSFFAGGATSDRAFQTRPFIGLQPSGRWLVTLNPFDGIVRFDDIARGSILTEQVGTFVFEVAFSADGTRAFVTANGGVGYLFNMEGLPSLVATTTFNRDIGPVVYDAGRDLFIVSSPFTAPSTRFEVSAQTGSILDEELIRADIFTSTILVDDGLVIEGGFSPDGNGVLLVGDDEFKLSGRPGEIHLSPQTHTVIAAIPGPDRIEFVALQPTAAAPTPQAEPLALRVGPIPSAGDVHVSFNLAAPEAVRMEVLDVRGRQVAAWSLEHASGEVRTTWDGRDARGADAPAGVYVLRVRAGGSTAHARVTLMR